VWLALSRLLPAALMKRLEFPEAPDSPGRFINGMFLAPGDAQRFGLPALSVKQAR
jgi:hypothetical protein